MFQLAGFYGSFPSSSSSSSSAVMLDLICHLEKKHVPWILDHQPPNMTNGLRTGTSKTVWAPIQKFISKAPLPKPSRKQRPAPQEELSGNSCSDHGPKIRKDQTKTSEKHGHQHT